MNKDSVQDHSYGSDKQNFAKLEAETSSDVKLLAGISGCRPIESFKGSSDPVKKSAENLRASLQKSSSFDLPKIPIDERQANANAGAVSSFAGSLISSGNQEYPFDKRGKDYNAHDANARLDDMAQALDAKIDRTHELLLQQMKNVALIMKKLQVDSIDMERRPS
jgi:hypothetical protein